MEEPKRRQQRGLGREGGKITKIRKYIYESVKEYTHTMYRIYTVFTT